MFPDSPTITYAARADATPEAELTTLTVVYAYLLKKRKAAGPAPEPDGRDGTKVQGDSADGHSISD